MRRFWFVLMLVFLVFGVQRSPEAQIGEAITLASGVFAVSGCVHAATPQRPDTAPTQLPPPPQ